MNLNRKTKLRYPNILNLIELEHDSDISVEPITEAVIKISSTGIISLFVDGEYYGTHNKSTLCLSDNTTVESLSGNTVITLQSKSQEDIRRYVYKRQITRKMIFEFIKKIDCGQLIEKNGICITFGKNSRSSIIDENGQSIVTHDKNDEYLIMKGGSDSYIICDNEKFPFNITLTQGIIY